jgi:uncharacterized pyridoxal phosphate-dependent enzyme
MSVYDELGVRVFINARAPYTRLGGAIMPAAVVEAMVEASRHSVSLEELQTQVGRAIAERTRNQAAYVSCGAASGVTLAVAGCIAGIDSDLADRLPHTDGFPNEVIMPECDRGTECDVAIRAAGGRIVHVGDQDGTDIGHVVAAICERTAAVLTVLSTSHAKPPVQELIQSAHVAGVPILIDAADSLPPRENLWKWTHEYGADAIIFSGGKGLRGPQSTGLVLGSRRVIEGCTFHGSPNHRIGRGMKVGKEELVGVYTALKILMDSSDEEDLRCAEEKSKKLLELLRNVEGLECSLVNPNTVLLQFSEESVGLTYRESWEWFMSNEPAVMMLNWSNTPNGICLRTKLLSLEQIEVVADQIRRFFDVRLIRS